MNSLVIYESMFGGTRHVAEAIATGLRRTGAAVVIKVGDVSAAISTLDLLVVGAPTHTHGLSSPETREEADSWSKQPDRHLKLESGAVEFGVREWLEDLETPVGHFAAFDTRADAVRLFTGSAAVQIDRHLRRAGGTRVVEPESFLVHENSLIDGELARAELWGESLAVAWASQAHSFTITPN